MMQGNQIRCSDNLEGWAEEGRWESGSRRGDICIPMADSC